VKISIITPSFNQGEFLEQTIDSVLSQRGVDVEYIIIDGGSTDNSVKIIKQYEKHLAYWVSEPDRGQSNAINKGLKKAKGDIANWLNSDDYLQPTALQIIQDYFLDPRIDVVAGRSNIIKDGKIMRQSNGTDVYKNNLPKTLGWARIDQPETFFRKKIFDQLGPINENLHYIMDKEFWTRYLIREGLDKIKKVPDILVNFRLHANSKTQSKSENFTLEENALMYQMAVTNHLHSTAQVIKQNLPLDLVETFYTYVMPEETLPRNALNYYLLYKADEFYSFNNHAKCLQLLASIVPENLSSEDLTLYKRLQFRSTFIPVFFKKIFRQWM
jgi:glycosyltransferase involved in cell wall biosynthesis